MKRNHNIFIIGKAGVGKTSLIDYLYGSNYRHTKSSRFYSEVSTLSQNIPTNIIDIQSIMIGNDATWLSDFYSLMKRRNTQNGNYDWLTTIMYVVSASGGRIENFELDIINDFLQKNIKIIIILSKADIADKSDLRLFKKVLNKVTKNEIKVVEICSVKKKIKSGETITFGRDTLLNTLKLSGWRRLQYFFLT